MSGAIHPTPRARRKRAVKRCHRRGIKPESARGWLRRQLQGF